MTAVLHPARARRMAAKLPPRPHHDALLRPLGQLTTERALIVTYTEPDFAEALFADLNAEDWRERLLARQNWERTERGDPRLSPPLHGKMNVVLFELACAMPGTPPVAPTKIDSMGFVLRRQPITGGRRIWRKQLGKPLGWHHIDTPSGLTPEVDPDPARQMALAPGRNDGLLEAVAELRNQGGTPAEEVFALNRVPPDICAKLGRTILFATLPLASSETGPAANDAVDYNALPTQDADQLDKHLSLMLGRGDEMTFSKGGDVISSGWKPREGDGDPELLLLLELLRQTQNELGLESGNSAARSLRRELDGVWLPMIEDGRGRVTQWKPAGQFLVEAAPILLGKESNPQSHRMPLRWPARNRWKGARLLLRARNSLTERAKEFQPDTPKFDNAAWRFSVKPFVRLSHGPNCPVRLVWGEESSPFVIRPWWDSDAPAQKISLPDIGDLKNVKPNVAFEMPPILANLLAQDPLDLAQGEGSKPSKLGLGWLCSFSIPIITICAFIVLNIFLQLFNLFFSWLLWIKICIPIPAKQEGE